MVNGFIGSLIAAFASVTALRVRGWLLAVILTLSIAYLCLALVVQLLTLLNT